MEHVHSEYSTPERTFNVTTLYRERNNSVYVVYNTGHVHTLALLVQVYALAGHAHVGICIGLVHGFVNMHAAN